MQLFRIFNGVVHLVVPLFCLYFPNTQLVFMIVEVDHGLTGAFRPQNTSQKHCQLLCPTALRARSL